jgi:HSP20 family protein
MAREPGHRTEDELEELFANLWQVPRWAGLRHRFRPSVDCFHTIDPHALVVAVELPGADPAAIEVTAGERVLVISGERKRPHVPGAVYQQVEIEYGPFYRRVRFAEDVDPGRATACFEHGLLTVTLPVAKRKAPQGPFTIDVSGG